METLTPTNGRQAEATEAGQLAEIKRRNALVAEKHAAYLESKEETSDRKKEWEGEAESLQRYISMLDSEKEEMPLFDDPAANHARDIGTAEADGTGAEPAPLWHSFGILKLCQDDCGLSAAVASELVDAGISTVGQLADWTNSGEPLTRIKGIGETSAEQIHAALERLWDRLRPPSGTGADYDADMTAAVEQAEARKAEAGGTKPGDDEEYDIDSDVDSEQMTHVVPDAEADARRAEPWRSKPVSVLDQVKGRLGASTYAKLAAFGIETLGQLDERVKTLDDQDRLCSAADIPRKTSERLFAAPNEYIARSGKPDIACNACDLERNLSVEPICRCGCPEFRRLRPVSEVAARKPKRERKAKAPGEAS